MKNRPVGVYSEPSDSSFSLPRGRQCRLPVLFQQLFRLQYRFFVTFFTEESNVFSSSALSRQKLLPLPPPPWLEPLLLLKVPWLLLPEEGIRTLTGAEMAFGYRRSF